MKPDIKLYLSVGLMLVIIAVIILRQRQQAQLEQLAKQQGKTKQQFILELLLRLKQMQQVKEANRAKAGNWIAPVMAIGDAVLAVWFGVNPDSAGKAQKVQEKTGHYN